MATSIRLLSVATVASRSGLATSPGSRELDGRWVGLGLISGHVNTPQVGVASRRGLATSPGSRELDGR